MVIRFVLVTQRLVLGSNRRKGELSGTTEDFSALKQELEGRKSEEIPSFDEGAADCQK